MSRIAHISLSTLVLVSLAGCGSGAGAGQATDFGQPFAQAAAGAQGLRSTSVDPLLGKLNESKISLVDGIRQAGSTGYVISAKFEMDGDNMMLSV